MTGPPLRTTPLWAEEFAVLSLVTPTQPLGMWYATEPYLSGGMVGEPDPASKLTWNANPNQDFGGSVGVMNPLRVGPVSDADGAPATGNSALTISCRRYSPDEAAVVRAFNKSLPGRRWGGTLISNHQVRTFTYGYFEFRACFPRTGRGMWPALWFFSAFGANGDDRAAAEIDVVEIFGPTSGSPWFSSLHQLQAGGTPAPGFNGSVNGFYRGDLDTTRWHTYGLDWQEDELAFYVDGERVARRGGRDAEYYRDVKLAIRLNYTMTEQGAGRASGPEDDSTPDPLTMCVDYVRQWSQFADSVPTGADP